MTKRKTNKRSALDLDLEELQKKHKFRALMLHAYTEDGRSKQVIRNASPLIVSFWAWQLVDHITDKVKSLIEN